MSGIIIMVEEDLNCYITKMFFQNTIDSKEIKVINFDSENMIMLKKTQIISKDKHDKIIMHKSKNTFNPIISFSNNTIYDNGAIDILSKVDWNLLEITEYDVNSLFVILFNVNNIWYISYDEIITKLDNIDNTIVRIFKNSLDESEIKLDELNIELTYHLMLTHPLLSKITQHDNKFITLLWTCDKKINLVDQNTPFDKKLKFFSCLDELLISVEMECNNDILNKSLTFGGYYIKVPYLFNNKTQYMCCVIRSNLLKHILTILPKNENKYINYLELYQKNELSDVITYLHKYPNDVIRRINMATRTLSKEILNIYHLTRKKQNFVLYTNLTQKFKKVLFELHKIYVTQKHAELKQTKDGIQLIEKKSISVDVVYDYLKSIYITDLVQIFNDRKNIINILSEEKYDLTNIFNLNDMYMITQIELMFSKN